jgi:hypothetical protein
MKMSKQLSRFHGYWEVQAFLDTPFAHELIDYEVRISMDGDSSTRAASEISEYLADTGIFGQIVGHCLCQPRHALSGELCHRYP